MTDQEVAANAALMFDAGYETTSTFLAFLTHVLVNRQEVQEEIRKEVKDLEERDGHLGHNVMHDLPYLDSVVYETLRFFPPVTRFVSRAGSTDYVYKDITIPAGVDVEVTVQELHHDPDLWKDPQTFDPLRFYGENKSRVNSPAFQAFGAGPRNCIGMRFALLEAKLAMASVLSRFKLIPGPRTEAFDQLEIKYGVITQNPKKGIFVKVIPLT